MKNLLLTWCFMVVSLLCMNFNNVHKGIPISYAFDEELDSLQSAIKLTEQQSQMLTEQFQKKYRKRASGGIINKTELQTILSSMPATSRLVNFRFCIDPSLEFHCLMICGDKKPTKSTSFIRCIRNGGNENSIFFNQTDWDENKKVHPVRLVYEDYLALNDTYQKQFPKEIFGGNIDKVALQKIIHSLPANKNNIVFRFYMLSNKKIGIIFIGGDSLQSDNEVLIFRNGKTDSSFAPIL